MTRLLVALLLFGLPARADVQKGIALGLFSEDAGWSYRSLLEEIAALGADHVELVVPWYVHDAASTEVYEHPRFSPPLSTVARTIREAHRASLRVLLFPIVRLEVQRRPDEWRGTYRPARSAAFFASYERKLLELARLAEQEQVALLSVGSEMSKLDVDRAPWARLIARVRSVYHGRLTYSGNWDHYRQVALYDLVDQMGVCAYFPLASRGRPVTPEDFAGRWQELRRELEEWAQKLGRPLLITEIGYLSQKGAAAWPWDEGAVQPIDLGEQERCYRAFADAWCERPSSSLVGVYFWNWYGWGGERSRGYTPRGKPAEDEIRRFFRGSGMRVGEGCL